MSHDEKHDLLFKNGFRFDILKDGWVRKGHVIDDHYLRNPSITCEQLEATIKELIKKPPLSDYSPSLINKKRKKPKKWGTAPAIDAMHFRFPGSYEAGKKR
jgi:hypothetical protein